MFLKNDAFGGGHCGQSWQELRKQRQKDLKTDVLPINLGPWNLDGEKWMDVGNKRCGGVVCSSSGASKNEEILQYPKIIANLH